MQSAFVTYLYINAISISILLNTLTGGPVMQTLSARNWENRRAGKFNWVWLIDMLVWFETDHCMQCWVRWRLGAYMTEKYDERVNNERYGPSDTYRL